MGCPVHIWLPLMGAAVPVARVVRDRVKSVRPRARREEPTAPARAVTKWPALAGQPVDDEPSSPA
jgi:hypothetical protein